MRISLNSILFVTAAFPFLIPLVPTTDTQPTFTLFILLFAVVAAAQSLSRQILVPRGDLLLAGVLFCGGLIWLCASIIANGFDAGEVNRIGSFVMLLIALASGILKPDLFSRRRVIYALLTYIFFTMIFFATSGAIERILIQSRGTGMTNLLLSGRGASTLSPEPSFFSFQIFTLYLMARLTIWKQLGNRDRRFVQLASIALLMISFSGYGFLYAMLIIVTMGFRYILFLSIAGSAALAFLIATYDVESLRFVALLTQLTSALMESNFQLKDVSILVRLTSFQDYLEVFGQHWFLGDAFSFYGGGGLVSLLAALGAFGLTLVLLIVVAIFRSGQPTAVKLALMAWLSFQFISGPVGLPLIGLLAGRLLSQSGIGRALSAVNFLLTRVSARRLSAPRSTLREANLPGSGG